MNLAKEYYKADLSRYDEKSRCEDKKLLKLLRKCQFSKNKFTRLINKVRLYLHSQKRGVEISGSSKIGKGLFLKHIHNITINGAAVIGENCSILKGATIGQENRGKRYGAPTIGNRVVIGINATVVGKIVIGDDVLIAAGAFVNCDVPSHSVVIGNPCIIKHRDNATEGYIKNTV